MIAKTISKKSALKSLFTRYGVKLTLAQAKKELRHMGISISNTYFYQVREKLFPEMRKRAIHSIVVSDKFADSLDTLDELADNVGGWDKLRDLLHTIKDLKEFYTMIELVGGWERAKFILDTVEEVCA